MYLYCISEYIKPITSGIAHRSPLYSPSAQTVYYRFHLEDFLFFNLISSVNRWVIPTAPWRACFCLEKSLRAYVVIFLTKLRKKKNWLTEHVLFIVMCIVHAGIILWDATVNTKIQIVQKCANSENTFYLHPKMCINIVSQCLKTRIVTLILRLSSSISPVQLALVTIFVSIDVFVLCSLSFWQ